MLFCANVMMANFVVGFFLSSLVGCKANSLVNSTLQSVFYNFIVKICDYV